MLNIFKKIIICVHNLQFATTNPITHHSIKHKAGQQLRKANKSKGKQESRITCLNKSAGANGTVNTSQTHINTQHWTLRGASFTQFRHICLSISVSTRHMGYCCDFQAAVAAVQGRSWKWMWFCELLSWKSLVGKLWHFIGELFLSFGDYQDLTFLFVGVLVINEMQLGCIEKGKKDKIRPFCRILSRGCLSRVEKSDIPFKQEHTTWVLDQLTWQWQQFCCWQFL